ncbi:MAG: DUF2892 domain-containing protein [Myxococcota bacterium]
MWSKIFPTNEGTVDRVARVVIGAGVLSLAFIGPVTPLGWIGIVPLATGLVGSCPLYRLFGVSTCKAPTRAT